MFREPWRYACLAAASMVFCSGATAAQLSRTAAPAKAGTTTSTVMFQGVQVAIDPATGRLREPTDAERQALTRAMQQKQAADAVTPLAAGQRPRNAAEAKATLKTHRTGRVGMSMQVPEDQLNYLEAERQADGRLSIHHQGDTQPSSAAREVTR